MSQDFYDKVASKFGNYDTPAKYIKECLMGNPEEIFKRKLLGIGGKDKIVLDAGCGDGRFTLSISSHFKKIIGNDTSRLMLNAAKKLQKEKGIKNVQFIERNTRELNYSRNYFNIIYVRRSPVDYPLFYKILKTEGHVLYIGIGEKDTMEIERVFGRGQNFGGFDEPRLEKEKNNIKNAGFEIIYAKNFYYNEYYLSFEDLDIFLQGVPIFEDYDSVKDRQNLEEYVKKHQEPQGIDLPRHRYVIVAAKE